MAGKGTVQPTKGDQSFAGKINFACPLMIQMLILGMY